MKYTTFQKWQQYFQQLEYDMDNFKGSWKAKVEFFGDRIEKSHKMHQEVIFGRMRDLGIKLEPTQHIHSNVIGDKK
jgi:hypothetical protein